MMLVQSSHLLLLWALDLPLLRAPELHNITSMPGASLLLCHFQLALFLMSLLTVGCSGDYFCSFQSLPSLAAVSLCFFNINLKSDKEKKNRSANSVFVLISAPHLHSTIVKPKEHQTWGSGQGGVEQESGSFCRKLFDLFWGFFFWLLFQMNFKICPFCILWLNDFSIKHFLLVFRSTTVYRMK